MRKGGFLFGVRRKVQGAGRRAQGAGKSKSQYGIDLQKKRLKLLMRIGGFLFGVLPWKNIPLTPLASPIPQAGFKGGIKSMRRAS